MKRLFFLLLTLIGFCSQEVCAQLSKTHYIPPFYANNNDGSVTAQEQALYISTPHVNANYTITDGAGNILQTSSVQEGSYESYYQVGYGTAFIADATELNKVLNPKGIIVSSDSSIYVNMRINAGSFNSPSQGASLTSKGVDALGTVYRLGHIPSPQGHARKSSGYGIMAVDNGTVVTINFKQKDVVFEGIGAPDPNVPLVINLNAGECYVGAIHSLTDPNNLDTGLIGSLVTSNKPIAVNTGSWAGSLINSGGADVGIDQIVDESLLGNQYVVVRGQGKNADDDEMEQVLIVAHYDNTSIFVNGSATPLATINAGEYYLIFGDQYINEVMYITSTENIFVYQIILGDDNSNNTQGMNFVPPITCYTSQEINNIPVVDSIGTKEYEGGVTVVTKKNSTILVNGLPPSVAPVEAVGSNYEAYKIEGLTGNVKVTTNTVALVGFFGYSGAAGYGGFFSGFDRVKFTSDIVEECPPGVLYSSSNLAGESQWYLDDVEIPDATEDTLSFSTEGNYYVVVTRDECQDTSEIIEIIPNPFIDLVEDFTLCGKVDSLFKTTPNDDETIEWFGTIKSNTILMDTAGTYWVSITNEKNCSFIDSIEVFKLDSVKFTSSITEKCPPGIVYSGSNTDGDYQWYRDDIKIEEANEKNFNYNVDGTYYMVLTKDECQDTTDLIKVMPNPFIDLGEDFTLCANQDFLFEARPNEGDTLKWFGTTKSNTILMDTAGVYWLTLTNDQNCSLTDSIEMFELSCTSRIKMPNIINPRGSENFAFRPIDAEGILHPKLEIYNRWGGLIATVYNLMYGWDGTVSGGKIVSAGVYYYILTYDSKTLTETTPHQQNGFIQVL